MNQISSLLPHWLKKVLWPTYYLLLSAAYYGDNRTCPICRKSTRKFKEAGNPRRLDAMCPFCDALERHRFLWVYLKHRTMLFVNVVQKILHVAPEKCLNKRFRKALGDGYLTADLTNPQALIKMDITDIQYDDQSFDVILCSHVLEHLEDDMRALKELNRVLKNDGWAILLVPIIGEKTIENALITSPEYRLKVFGQEDHVRVYGADYIDRLRQAGFVVEVTEVEDILSNSEIEKLGLSHNSGPIFFCTKEG